MTNYTTPTLVEHGNLVEETRGCSNSTAECCGKRPSPDEDLEPDIGTSPIKEP